MLKKLLFINALYALLLDLPSLLSKTDTHPEFPIRITFKCGVLHSVMIKITKAVFNERRSRRNSSQSTLLLVAFQTVAYVLFISLIHKKTWQNR